MVPTLKPVKRGDTFSISCIYKQDGQASSLEQYTIRSQVRGSDGNLVEELDVAKANQSTNPGVFVLSAGAPIDWPADVMSCDIQFVQEGSIRSTQTFLIPVEEDVTHD